MVQKKLPLINSAHDSETRNIINELIKLFNDMGYTYNEALKKAHDVLDEAQKKSNNVLTEAERVNSMNESVQQQINTLIAESGTSDAELVQARIDAEGNEYAVIKERLDHSDQKLSQKMTRKGLPISLADMGVHHENTADENTALIKSAVDMAMVDGREILLPSTPENEYIDINDGIHLDGLPITVRGHGRTSKIRQLTFKKPCFSLDSVGQTARDFSVYGVEFDGYGQGAESSHYAGIHIKSHDATVTGIFGDDIPTIVRVTDGVGILDNANITDIESGENVIFNLLAGGTSNLYFDNIRGSYKFFNHVSTPPHLIYFSEGRPNYNVNGGKAFAYDGKDSFAFQFKGMIGGKIDYLYSEGCEGALHLMYAEGLSIGEVRSIKDTHKSTEGQGALAVHTGSSDITIGKVDIEMESSGKPVLFASPNSIIKELNVVSNHPTDDLATIDVDIRGDNTRVFEPKVKNIGAGRVKSSISMTRGQGIIIDNPTTSGNETGVSIGADSVEGAIINYKPNQQTECDKKITTASSTNKIIGGDIPGERSKVLAFDDFHILLYGTTYNFSNMTSSGDEWLGNTAEQMYVDVVKGQAYMESAQSAGAKKWVDVGTANLVLEAKITHESLESLIFRVISTTSFLGAMIIDNKAVIYEYVGGVISTYANLNILASVDFVPQQGRRYYQKVDVYGDQVDYYINDQLMCSATLDSTLMDNFGSMKNHGILGRGNPSGTFEEIRWISNE